MMRGHFALLLVLGFLPACVTPEPSVPSLAAAEVEHHLPAKVKDRGGWAADIIAGIEATGKAATLERVCAVVAIIGQESGFQTDPVVSDLPRIVRHGLEVKFAKLGPLAPLAVTAVLATKAPGATETFEKRVAKLRTERDLDRLFRDIASAFRDRFPGSVMVASAVSKILGKGWLDDLNPVTTAGSMQVEVAFAKELEGLSDLSDAALRERLYDRADGVRAGSVRLLGYDASYADIIYRFADYNAGVYAARNAAFQSMLAELTNQPLTLDGDLLAYNADGGVKSVDSKTMLAMLAFGKGHELSEWSVRRAANQEKKRDFEDTDIWAAVRGAWEKKTGKKPAYARIPTVTLVSPKMSVGRTTAWFAEAVKRRYGACRTAKRLLKRPTASRRRG